MTVVLLGPAAPDAPRTYVTGSGLEVPGLEAVMEYGVVSDVSSGASFLGIDANGRVYGAQRLNDRSALEQVHVTEIDGLYDDPESQEVRSKLPSQNGERSGLMTYAGRTIGLTGDVRAGSIPAMRDVERRLKSSLGEVEKSLLIHPPGEVAQLVNASPDPLGASTATYGTRVTTSGTTNAVASVTDGVLSASELSTATNTTGAGSMYAQAAAPWVQALQRTWLGQDVWIHARVKVQAASTAATSLEIRLAQYDQANTVTLLGSLATQASPATGTWYTLSALVPVASISPTTVGLSVVAMLNYGAAGSYTLRWTRVALVPVPPGALTPLYFDGSMPGFEWDGPAPSRSRGPTHVVNQVPDPLATSGASWTANNSAGATVNTAPAVTLRSGLLLDNGQPASAIYYKVTNPSATSRVLALATSAGAGLVASGRTYAIGISLNVLQKPAATTALQVVWLDQAGAVLSTTSVTTVTVTGAARYTGNVVAPLGSVSAFLQVAVTTAVSGAVLELYATRATRCDVTEHGQVFVGDEPQAVLGLVGARGPIKRPFLVKRVRKASYSCPEKQSNLLPRRDFTLSLRASDPRKYRLDEHNVQLQMAGTPNFVSQVPSIVGSGNYTTFPAPTGFTSDATASGGTGTYLWVQTTIPTTPSP